MAEPNQKDHGASNAEEQQANPYANGNNPFARRRNDGGSPYADPDYNPYSHPVAPQPGQPPEPNASRPPYELDGQPTRNENAPQPPVGFEPDERPEPEAPVQPDRRNQVGRPENPSDSELPPIPAISKAVWFSAGLVLGVIGLLLVVLTNVWRPRAVRNQVLFYAGLGIVVGAIINLVVLNVTGVSTGTGLMGSIPGFSGADAPTTGSGIF